MCVLQVQTGQNTYIPLSQQWSAEQQGGLVGPVPLRRLTAAE